MSVEGEVRAGEEGNSEREMIPRYCTKSAKPDDMT